MNKKVTLLSAAIASILAAPAMANINDVIISEYVEGSSYNKAIELTNIGSETVKFPVGTALTLTKDGGKEIYTSATIDLSEQSLDAGQSLVIHHSKPSNKDTNLLDALAANVKKHNSKTLPTKELQHNGNDVVALTDLSNPDSPIFLDAVGTFGNSKKHIDERTLQRLDSVKKQNATFNLSEWVTKPQNTFDGLGDPTLAAAEPAATPCSDASGMSRLNPGEIQGNSFKSPLIQSGFISDDEYLVQGVVSAVSTSLTKGFFLYAPDGDELTSDGIFIKTGGVVSEEMVGQEICVKGFVEEKYGQTQVKATDDKWEIVNATPVKPKAVDLKRIPSDGQYFRKTLERHEGMLVRLTDNMDESTKENETMRVSRTFSYDYDGNRNNMVLAYKRPNMQPNQEHVAGSDGSIAQDRQNNDYRLYVETDQKAADGEIPFYPDFNDKETVAKGKDYIRVDDSITGLEGVISYSYGDYRLMATNTISGKNITHNTDRKAKPQLNDSTTSDKFAIRIATQNVLNYFNSPFGGPDNPRNDNRGADSELEFRHQHAKIVKAINSLDADIIGLMEIENNGFGNYSAITELVNAVNEYYYKENYSSRNDERSTHNQYVFVGFDSDGNMLLDEFDSIGSDAITSGLLYRPSKVSLEQAKIIPMPSQQAPMITYPNGSAIVGKKGEIRENGKNYQRDTIAATFRIANTGKKLTVSVNHLKSKGSTCWEDWQGWESWEGFDPVKHDVKNADFQGSCENFRVAAAYQLGKEMAKIGGDRVIIGDMNSYAHEDPMLVLTSNPTGKTLKAARDTLIGKKPQFGSEGGVITQSYGYLNAVSIKDAEKNKTSWSYSYNDEIGSLDHILITPSLEKHLLDATDWHINAAESKLFDYNQDRKGLKRDEEKAITHKFYADNAYRSSDHDSAIMALGYGYGETDGSPVLLTTDSGRMDVPYAVPTDKALEGDIAEISFSPSPEDMSKVALPKVTLDKAKKQLVNFDVSGIEPGDYTVTMQLKRPVSTKSNAQTEVVTGSQVSMKVTVAEQDSKQPKVVVPPYDGSGGSFGLFGMLSLLGLGFLRRAKK
ncbi:nuclease [Photobacterium jeanii]|uniref:Nuclease n=1 Tax=Photobacterium jeanii TaxID=858640 RepID=A0A178KM99_9GAMM|nr:ExeM/NucH family extracellular endonuclease [Photobacterium jeanii]OAN18125.1 nuclease [Photobacterium jeanii]PST92200.1 nuclease [Photobacterium jeanii]